ncbi:MAG: NUDIX domain-containing protein [Alphaproteobacteria bacterium]|nr:NUDIX domain-containing protein [Alphaproteobacteria bacterium]
MLQFGVPSFSSPSIPRYKPRHAVFGLAIRGGNVACVAVKQDSRCYFDLPGGGVRDRETEEDALIREFEEEVGLKVKPQLRLAEAGQFFSRSDGNSLVYNYGGFWIATVQGSATQSETNHRLCWLAAPAAIASLRHESHAWLVLAWLRWPQRAQGHYGRADAEEIFRNRPYSKTRGAEKKKRASISAPM